MGSLLLLQVLYFQRYDTDIQEGGLGVESQGFCGEQPSEDDREQWG